MATATPQYGAFAAVLTGWTGEIIVGSRIVTPRDSESVASMLTRLAEVCLFDGLTLTMSVDASGVITLAGSSVFTVTLSGLCATRTGFTSTYSGAATYTAAAAYSGFWVPTRGMRMAAPLLATTGGAQVASGDYGHAGRAGLGSTQFTAWTSYADTWAREDDTGTFDYWHDGRFIARAFLEKFSRSRMGRINSAVQLSATMQGVVD